MLRGRFRASRSLTSLEFTESGHAPVKIELVVVGAMTSVLVEIDVVAVGKQLKLIMKGII